MKKLLLAMLFAAVLIAAASPLRAQVPMTFLSYYGSQMDALNALINRSLDSPPYVKGSYGVNTTSTSILWGFRSTQAKAGYFCYTYIMIPSTATGPTVSIAYRLNGVVRRLIYLSPGGSIADYVACDSLTITKDTATDPVYYGGYYNR